MGRRLHLNEALLRAVIDDPDEDLPRLAFADLLEEQGEQARSEFIRVQLELARTPDCIYAFGGQPRGNCSYCRLMRRSMELLAYASSMSTCASPYYHRRLGPVRDDWQGWHSQYAYPTAFYRRGFVEEIVCSWAWWEQHHAEVLAQQPVRRVYLTTLPDLSPYEVDSVMPQERREELLRWWIFTPRWPRLEFVLPKEVEDG